MREDVIKIIHGCLRDTIRAHGPITHDLMSSASKRIASALLRNYADETLRQETLRHLQEKYDQENRRLQHRNERLHRRVKTLLDALWHLRQPVAPPPTP